VWQAASMSGALMREVLGNVQVSLKKPIRFGRSVQRDRRRDGRGREGCLGNPRDRMKKLRLLGEVQKGLW